MAIYYVERVCTFTNRNTVTTKWHVMRKGPDGTTRTLRRFARRWEALNACDVLNGLTPA